LTQQERVERHNRRFLLESRFWRAFGWAMAGLVVFGLIDRLFRFIR
jgi:hypothetical protein